MSPNVCAVDFVIVREQDNGRSIHAILKKPCTKHTLD